MCDLYGARHGGPARFQVRPKVTNSYLSTEIWTDRRNALAGSMLVREAAALLAGKPIENLALVEAAIEAANVQMAEIGMMPEDLRDEVEAA